MWQFSRPDAVEVLKDAKAQGALGRYFASMGGALPAKFMIAKKVPAGSSVGDLWQEHDSLLSDFREFQKKVDTGELRLESLPSPKKSLLDLKVEIAGKILSECNFCERACRVNRIQGKTGFCSCGVEPQVSSYFTHLGEEPELVPSFTIFFMGCTFQCCFCQNYPVSQWLEAGRSFSIKGLASLAETAKAQGCRNVNFVGGDPTPWTHAILEAMRLCGVSIPVVWNSNAGYSLETAKLLQGFADVYLLDFKYGPGECSVRLSNFENYWEVSKRNHIMAVESGELIIRHLVLPGHLECCTKPIFEWIASELGKNTRVNIMFQYRPEYRAYELPELRINRRLTNEEMKRALEIADEVGLENYIT